MLHDETVSAHSHLPSCHLLSGRRNCLHAFIQRRCTAGFSVSLQDLLMCRPQGRGSNQQPCDPHYHPILALLHTASVKYYERWQQISLPSILNGPANTHVVLLKGLSTLVWKLNVFFNCVSFYLAVSLNYDNSLSKF